LTEFSKHSMRSQENIVRPSFFTSYSVRGLDGASEINWEETIRDSLNSWELLTKFWNKSMCSLNAWSCPLGISEVQNLSRAFFNCQGLFPCTLFKTHRSKYVIDLQFLQVDWDLNELSDRYTHNSFGNKDSRPLAIRVPGSIEKVRKWRWTGSDRRDIFCPHVYRYIAITMSLSARDQITYAIPLHNLSSGADIRFG
jgi:hypothetical protein